MISRTEFDRLLGEARAGSKEAWGELLVHWYPYLVRLGKAYLGEPALGKDRPSDVAQATFARAIEKAAQFAGKTPEEYQAWLRTLTQTVSSNQTRQHARWQAEEAPDGLLDPAPMPETLFARQEWFDHLLRYVSEEELLVIGLWLEGYPWQEIGAKAGATPDAARMLKGRAISRLAKGLFEVM